MGASASPEVRVYYEDTDAAGVVYHAATSGSWSVSVPLRAGPLDARGRTVFTVAGLKLDFLKPARFNDRRSVDVVLLQLGLASLILAHSVTRQAIKRQAITPESANHEAVISGPEVLRGPVRIDAAAGLCPKPLPPSLLSALRHGS